MYKNNRPAQLGDNVLHLAANELCVGQVIAIEETSLVIEVTRTGGSKITVEVANCLHIDDVKADAYVAPAE